MSNLTYQLDFGADLSAVKSAQAEFAKLKHSLAGLAEIAGVAAIGESFRRGMADGIRFNSKLEEIRRGLTAVKGSAGLAASGLGELQRLEGQSRFDVSELGAASRQLEVMTNGALSAGSGLRLVMDVAAGTDAPLASVADALGRVYGQIRAGDPELGRGMQQLVMMGAISSSTKNQIEALAHAGATSAEQWTALSASLGRFQGQAATAAGTMAGLKFQLAQAFEEAMGGATEGLFSDLKAQMAGLGESLRSGPAGAALKDLMGTLAAVVAAGARFVGWVTSCGPLLATLTSGIKALAGAWLALKIANAVQGMSAWIAAAWRGVAATQASVTAITAETQALAANAAAKRASSLSERFAPEGSAAPGGAVGRQLLRERRAQAAPARKLLLSGTTQTQTYTQDMVDNFAPQAAASSAAAGAKAGSRFAAAFTSALGVIKNNFGPVLAAATAGWGAGRSLRSKFSGEASESDYDKASGQGQQNDATLKGYQERARAVGSVTEKLDLQKQLEAELAEQRAKVQSANLSNPEKEVANAQIAVLINLRRYVQGLDEAKLKAQELARAQAETRERNAPKFDATIDKMAIEDQSTRRDQAIESAGTGAGGPMAQLRLVRSYLAQAKADLGQINLADTANPQYDKLIARAERLRDLIKELTGKDISLGKTVDDGARARDQLAMEIKILQLRTSGTAVQEQAAERQLEISKKTAELLPLYGTSSAAAAAATKFVDADLASKAFRPSGEALRPQANNFERVGMFVGGAVNVLQQRATEATVQSRAILQQMYNFMRENKTVPGTQWGAS